MRRRGNMAVGAALFIPKPLALIVESAAQTWLDRQYASAWPVGVAGPGKAAPRQ